MPQPLLPTERTNLPLELTSFVGRLLEIVAVKKLVSEARLVTLTGAGGIGKTRLALQVATQLMDNYGDGVWLVELAALTDPELVPQIVLTALGFRARPESTPIESLISALAPREILCVIDNCEHLVEACARLADKLLRSCPRLRILATSRNVLGVGGEITWRVPSMATPDVLGPLSLEELHGYETVQLFARRADAARPGYQLTEANAPSAARVCQRLDGIPLAIELAAARIRTMSLTAIDERLDYRFGLLTGGSRVSMPRQRTLQATLDWSHDLLSDEERRLFRCLSVFIGGFTLEAAETVCANAEIDYTDRSVLEGLTGLVDKSLVVWEEGSERSGRYRLLETIRQYASERLSEAQEVDWARRSHASLYLALGEQMHRELRGPGQSAWMARVEDELDNLRACFEWALSNDPASALRLGVALERYWIASSPAEGLDWLTRALEVAPDGDESRAAGLYDACFWAAFCGDFDEARRIGRDCLSLSRQLGSDFCIGQALSALAAVEANAQREGWFVVSLQLFDQAEPHLRKANDPEALARFLNNYGYTLYASGDPIGGRPKVEEALGLARERGDTWQLGPTLDSLADIAFQLGDTVASEAYWKEALSVTGGIASRTRVPGYLDGLARLAMLDNQPRRCLRLLAAADAIAKRSGSWGDSVTAFHASEARNAAHQLIGQEAANAAWREGARMSLAEAVRCGLGDAVPLLTATPPKEPTATTAEPRVGNTFVREGEFWSVTYGGVVARLRDSKGLRDVARLLATPGREVAAVDLASGEHQDMSGRAATIAELGLGVEADAGEVLDAEARAQYRARVADLEEDIAGAEADHDLERASRRREEKEFLVAELMAAVGLGGRPRRSLDPGERARKAVTGRVRDAIRHMEAAHSDLGRHLRRSVRTGSFCVYDPTEPVDWKL